MRFTRHPAAVVLLAILPVTWAIAETEAKQSFNIPRQSLSSALLQFSEITGVKTFFNADMARNIMSPGLSGNYTRIQALDKLLVNTGLSYRFTDTESVTLVAAKGKTDVKKVPQTAPETLLKPMTVVAEAVKDVNEPYNPDYVIPNASVGTKTDTPIMETPLNVQVISKQVLKDQQVISLDKALSNVSGVTTQPGLNTGLGNSFVLRGFSTNTLFRNGFRLDNFNGFDDSQQFANVESIEVLKGPAAILYGRVEPGGMINITTKMPRAVPYYSFNQQFGSFSLFRTSIDATGPLTKDDTLLYRMNASFQSNNTFRDLVKNEDVFLAPVIRWNISPRSQATLEMEYQHQNTNFDPQILPMNGNQLIRLPPSRNLMDRNPLEKEHIFVGFNWSHQFNDDWSIKHQVNFKRLNQNQGISANPSSVNLDTSSVDRSFTQASLSSDTIATILDLSGHFKTWGLDHTLLVGGDYYRYNFSQHNLDAVDLNTFTSLTNSVQFDQPVSSSVIQPNFKGQFQQNVDNYGVYLQDQIKLPYNLHVMGGFRYQYIHQVSQTGQDGGALTIADFNPPVTNDATTPRVGLVWQPQKWLSLYSNYAESFGASLSGVAFGGLDASGNPLPAKPLPATSAQQWEIGTKMQFFDGRLRATLAYYDLTKQNVATPDLTAGHECNGGGALSCWVAIGEVRSRGPELDIQGEILPGWNVIATYANQDVRVSKSNDTVDTNPGNVVGNRLQFVPRNMGSAWTTYEVHQGDLKGFKIGGGVRLQDSVVDATNTFKSPGFALVGLLAGYSFEVGKSKITAQLNVDNLLDKTYITNVAPQPGANFGFVTFSTPRTFMGSINIQY